MTIDPTKIKPGDKVTVEGVFKQLHDDGDAGMIIGDTGLYLVPVSAIVSHTPAPREFKVGDRAQWKHGPDVKILGVRRNKAWVETPAEDTYTVPLSDLTHIEGEPG